MWTVVKILFSLLACQSLADAANFVMVAAWKKIYRCFERANQLLSLLFPVSDINRIALERGGGTVACSTLTRNSHPVFR
jgi:hypothetical protein